MIEHAMLFQSPRGPFYHRSSTNFTFLVCSKHVIWKSSTPQARPPTTHPPTYLDGIVPRYDHSALRHSEARRAFMCQKRVHMHTRLAELGVLPFGKIAIWPCRDQATLPIRQVAQARRALSVWGQKLHCIKTMKNGACAEREGECASLNARPLQHELRV